MTNAPQASQPAAQRSPLDILEEILGDKGAAGGPGGDAAAASPPAPTQPDEAAQLAEIKALEAERLAQDQVDLVAKQQELESAKQTPAYQARLDQAAAEQQQAQSEAAAQAGYEIKQVQHIKIQEE